MSTNSPRVRPPAPRTSNSARQLRALGIGGMLGGAAPQQQQHHQSPHFYDPHQPWNGPNGGSDGPDSPLRDTPATIYEGQDVALTLPFAWSHSTASRPDRDPSLQTWDSHDAQLHSNPVFASAHGERGNPTLAGTLPHGSDPSLRQTSSTQTPPLSTSELSPSPELRFHAPPFAQASDGWLDTHGLIANAELQPVSPYHDSPSPGNPWDPRKSPFSEAYSIAMLGSMGENPRHGQAARQIPATSGPAPLVGHVRTRVQPKPHKRSSMIVLPVALLAPSNAGTTEFRRHTDGQRVVPLNLHNSGPLRGPYMVSGSSSHTLVHHHFRRKLRHSSTEPFSGLELPPMNSPSMAGGSPARRSPRSGVPTSVQDVLLQGQRGSGCGGGDVADNRQGSRSYPMPSAFQLYDKSPSHMEDLHLQVCACVFDVTGCPVYSP